MKIRPFAKDDWFVKDPVEGIRNPPAYLLDRLLEQGVAISVLDDEGVVGMGGIVYWREDEAEAWIRLDRRALDNTVRVARAVYDAFLIILSVVEVPIIAHIDTEFPAAQRLAKWLEFTPTGELLNVGKLTYEVYKRN